jgi:hypothetical protein
VPTVKSAKQKRKRCQNCNKLFVPARNVPDQKFCKDKCRREFWTHGSAFGPMKAGLYSAIDKKYAALEASIKLRFREAHNRIAMVEAWKAEMRDQSRRIDRLEKIIEGSPTLTVERDQARAREQAG